MNLTLAHSPDSDDLVMWWPLCGMTDAAGKPVPGELGEPAIDTGGIVFRSIAEDVEKLNRRAIESGDLDITAISAHTYPHVRDTYRVTRCGGSFGEGYGPKVVVRADDPRFADGERSIARLLEIGHSIAVPGRMTTAYLTLSILLREIDAAKRMTPVPMPFQEVIGAVQREEVAAGLLIHEAQLTFEDAGLKKLVDLGAWWATNRGGPLPLGLNVLRRDLEDRVEGGCERVADLLRASVEHAVASLEKSKEFLRMRGGDRPEWNDEALVERYLSMYVSGLTRDMGDEGVAALERLLGEGAEAGLCPEPGAIDVI
ncbi:MAG: menaquinone biosynthesis family protein [Phycisphaerales bacterium]